MSDVRVRSVAASEHVTCDKGCPRRAREGNEMVETKRPALNVTVGTVLLVALAVGGVAGETKAEGTCNLDISLLGRWDEDVPIAGFSDVWAEGDVAYVGARGNNNVYFIDISDPANPVRILTWSVPSPNDGASAQDVKVHDGLLFIGLESNNIDGVEIVDVRDPWNPVHLTWIDTPGYSHVHNLFYDSGYLYQVVGGTPQVGIVDLTDYDPDVPPARISEHLWVVGGIGSSNVHDITVIDGRLYACGWNSGLFVYDVSNIANAPPVFLGAGPSSPNTHSVWPTADGRWAVVGEERSRGPLQLYEIIPNGASLDIVLRDSFTISGSGGMHNPIVVGTRVYASWYRAGVQIFDIDEDTASFVKVASFDATLGNPFELGTWGIYPLLGADRVLASDVANGLFILDTSGGDCSDGVFCNGAETCNGGECVAGSDPCPGQLCRESDDQCFECFGDGDCDNGAFCDGLETCTVAGACVSDAPPCVVGSFCLEESDRCVDCLNHADCDDALFCTEDRCVNGACENERILYGDGNLDGVIDLNDILCVLDGFAGNFKRCEFATLDIAGCAPNHLIDLSDIIAVLDAFAGLENCCDEP